MPFSSKIANDLLWTPFDNKSINPYGLYFTLTEDEFLEECFSNPLFIEKIDITQADGALFNDEPLTSNEMLQLMDEEREKYKDFLNWSDMFENHKVYTLSGNSGTGKTTLLHNLKREIKKYEWSILDVATSPERFDWLGDISTTIHSYERATRKTLTSILQEIHKLLFNESSDGDKVVNIYNNLKSVVESYEARFKNKYMPGCTLFDQLYEIFHNEQTPSIQVECAAKEFAKYFDNTPNDDDFALLDKAMDVLLLLLRCTDKNTSRKHIIVFDNFERFVSQDEIYNKEINEIRKRLAVYDRRINQKNNHEFRIKFIMTIRCTTARICGIKLHPADEKASDIDISSWFSIDDILKRKIAFLDKRKIKDSNYALAKQISGDFRQCANGDLTGIQLFLSPLFNDNKRLIIDFLGIIIEGKENKEKFNYKYHLNKYEENWNLDTDISRCAARNIIKGIVLYKLKNIDDLFKNMKVVRENKNTHEAENGLGLARRILTIIYNKSLENHNEILLSEVVGELYATKNINTVWRNPEYSKKRSQVSQIIYHMTTYNRRDNDWIQFIDLQYDDANKKLKISNASEMEKVLYSDFEKFHITIMPAGITYLKHIVASFEYFSVRYTKNYQPLFSAIPSPNTIENVSDIKKLECYKIIENVKKYAISCINNIHDHNLKIRIKNDRKTHAERIVNFHRFYLDNFIKYIQVTYINSSEISENAKNKYQELIEEVLKIRNEYKL